MYVYFLGLLPVESATAEGLKETLLSFLYSLGLTDKIMKVQFVGFCSDGASTMTGQHNGLAALLTANYPLIKPFHCMAHRLELAVKNATDTVNSVSHFRDLVDGVYKVYSMSPKNQREIEMIAGSLSVELMKVQKVFDVRWVFSSFMSVTALLRDLPALYEHFNKLSSPESDRSGKEKSKYSRLAKKLRSWFVVAEACMLKDALRSLKQLSLYMQGDDASVLDAHMHVNATKLQLLAFKDGKGKTLLKFLSCFESSNTFKGLCIEKSASDEAKFITLRNQFFQALHDNISSRFPATSLMSAATVLVKATWPEDPLERALFGEAEVAYLCKQFAFAGAQAAEIVLDFSMHKQGKAMTTKLRNFVQILQVLPVSSAACERGFSQMNLHHTAVRNRLAVTTLHNLLMISINGPCLREWNVNKYALSWLRTGRHGALDKPTGKGKSSSTKEVKKAAKLFA